MAESECLAEFRFQKRDVARLADVLNIPQTFRCEQGSTCDGIEGLCLLLRRLSFPCRYGDMIPRFGKPAPVLGMITNTVLDYIYAIHGHRINTWIHNILDPQQLEIYATAITARGTPLENCFGFIDGTVRPIVRPGENQRVLYNGHKRVHAIKFQSVVIPNGLIANMYGPVGKTYTFPANFSNLFYDKLLLFTNLVSVSSVCFFKTSFYFSLCGLFQRVESMTHVCSQTQDFYETYSSTPSLTLGNQCVSMEIRRTL